MTFYLKQIPGTETARSQGEQARAEVERTVAQKWEDDYKEWSILGVMMLIVKRVEKRHQMHVTANRKLT